MKRETVKNPLDRCLDALQQHDSYLITGHVNPDGDCLGSQIALGHFLTQRGKEVHLVTTTPPKPLYEFLPHFDRLTTRIPDRRVDAAIVLDSGDISRTGRLRPYLESLDVLINIDHHPKNGSLGDVNLVCPEASSVGEIVYTLFKRAREPITPEVALALYVTLLTDTGSFRHANTRARTHEAAAELIRIGGFNPYDIYSKVYERESFGSTLLQGKILSSLQRENGIVWADVPLQFFEETDTNEEDLNEVMDHFRRIEGCRVALLFREQPDGTVKINFRAKDDLDLLSVVEQFGGGGHQKAAGATVKGSLPEVRRRVIEALKEVLDAPVRT